MLIPVVIVGMFVLAMITEIRDARAEERRRVTHSVPGLGDFSSTDNETWAGTVLGLPVLVDSPGQPPTAAHAERVRKLLDALPQHTDRARAYLEANDVPLGTARVLAPESLSMEDDTSFFLSLVDSSEEALGADPTVYEVQFENDVPVWHWLWH